MRLQANENPYPALSGDQLNLPGNCLNTYPEEGYPALTLALSKMLNVPRDLIEVGNGSDELLDVIFRACLKPGQRVATLSPSFSEYGRFFKINHLEAITMAPDQDFGFTSEARFLELIVTEQPDAVILCNPNNPTGQFFKSDFIEAMLKILPASALVILDEAYMDFVPNVAKSSRWFLEDKRVIQVRTLSKAYSLAGLRIGYCMADKELLSRLAPYLAPYRINHPAYYYACQRLALNADAVEIPSLLASKSQLSKKLQDLGFQVADTGEGNFLWITAECPDLTARLKALQAEGILIRRFSSQIWSTQAIVPKDYWRITIGTPTEMETLLLTINKGVPHAVYLKSV